MDKRGVRVWRQWGTCLHQEPCGALCNKIFRWWQSLMLTFHRAFKWKLPGIPRKMEINKVLKHFSRKKSKLKNSNAILKHAVSRIIFCCTKTINLSILLLYHILTKKSLCIMSVYEHWSDFGREKIEHYSRKNGALKRKRTFKWGTKSIMYKSLPR